MKLILITIGLLTFGSLSIGCDGTVNAGTVDRRDPADPADPKDPTDPEEEIVEVEFPPAVELHRESIKLLPFHVRMNKLANVSGLPTTDPIFSELWRNRYPLGDHNYAQTIGPDLNWTAQKMSLWVRSIQPICNSDAMATAYPSMKNDIDAFWLAATGSPIGADQRSDIVAEIDAAGFDPAAEYQAVCVAVLSSAEFVAQ